MWGSRDTVPELRPVPVCPRCLARQTRKGGSRPTPPRLAWHEAAQEKHPRLLLPSREGIAQRPRVSARALPDKYSLPPQHRLPRDNLTATPGADTLPAPAPSQTSAVPGTSRRIVSNGKDVVLNSDSDNDSLPDLDFGLPAPKPTTPKTTTITTRSKRASENAEDGLRLPTKKVKDDNATIDLQTTETKPPAHSVPREPLPTKKVQESAVPAPPPSIGAKRRARPSPETEASSKRRKPNKPRATQISDTPELSTVSIMPLLYGFASAICRERHWRC